MAVTATTAVLGGTLLALAPAAHAAGEAATASPNTGLTDGQHISVSGTGFTPNSSIQIEQCAGTVASPPQDNTSCDATTLDVQATSTSSGAFTNAPGDANGDTGFQVFTLGVAGSTYPNSTIHCDSTHACVLYVGVDQNNFSASHTFVDIAFAGPAATPGAPVSPTPQAMTASNLGSASITIDYGTAKDSNNVNETINKNSVVVTNPTHGSVTATSPGVFKYTNTDGTATSDTFVVQGATATCTETCNPTTSTKGNDVTVNVTVQQAVAYPSSCDVTQQPSCLLKQIVSVPVSGADLTMSQAGDGSNPVIDNLNGVAVAGTCNAGRLTLNGKPQYACGTMAPITIVNARGTDDPWELTGQVGDFLDTAAPAGMTCHTKATYNNHCIPGDNMSWTPAAGVAHDAAQGDVATVTPGAAVGGQTITGAVLYTTGALAGQTLQAAGVTGPAPTGGLRATAATLCKTASTTSGGSFVCGAALTVLVPASAAASGSPYTATLTLTLA